MRMGVHQRQLAEACTAADHVLWYQPEHLDWDLHSVIETSPVPAEASTTILGLIQRAIELISKPAHVIIMSNGGFGGIHQQFIDALRNR